MTTHRRFGIAAAGLALSALLGTGCDAFDFEKDHLGETPPRQDPPPTMTPPPEMTPVEEPPPPRTCSAVVPEATPAYEAMCRHYCDTLEETHLYLDLAAGRPPEPAGATSQLCYEIRCEPRCVPEELCFTQCGAVASHYEAVCADAESAPDTVCPLSPADHDAACRAGCRPATEPPDDVTR
jgi:hypothetical protein